MSENGIRVVLEFWIWVPGEVGRWDRELSKRLSIGENVAVIGMVEN